MNINEIIQGRRSVRRYTDKPISDQDLNDILESGLWAPSAVNLQPWYCVVCKSQTSKEKLLNTMGGSMYSFSEFLNNRFKSNPEVVDETLNFVKNMGNAQVYVLVFLQKDYVDEEFAVIQSAAAAIENMILTAYSKGIGSCWLTAPLHAEDEIRKEFAPNKGRLVAAVTLGYSEIIPNAPKRKKDRFIII
jgi:nitroreductase